MQATAISTTSQIGKAIYPVRIVGYVCAIIAILVSEWFFEHNISWQVILFTSVALLYPHIAYIFYIRGGKKRGYEFVNLLLDMFWIGWIVALLHFSPITALPFVISNSATNYSTGGMPLFSKGLWSFLAGLLFFGTLNSFRFEYAHDFTMLVPSSVYMTLSLHYIAYLSFTRGEKILRSRQEILRQHEQLEQSLKEQQEMQTHLIQAEKLAVMGKLVASVAHEINTPLGAIRSSAGNIEDNLQATLQELPTLFQTLALEQQTLFFALMAKALANKKRLSSKEERQIRLQLTLILETHTVPDAGEIARELVDIGIHEGITEFLPILQAENVAYILKMIYYLVNQQKSLANISIAVEKASKVVFALKNYARKDNSQERVTADVQEGIDTILTLYHSQMKQHIELVKVYEEVPPIFCYPEELNQVWTNLIHNAMQAMQYKGVLEIGIKHQTDKVQVYVKDSGSGIPENVREKIFEPFFTTKPVGEGSGLGLDIVKKIVEKHAGSIYYETEVGKGTTFFVELPIAS